MGNQSLRCYYQNYLRAKKESINKVSNIKFRKIIDLGCGEGRLQESVEHTGCKIRSFDIMQLKPFIIKADISNLKLKCMMILILS